MRSTRFREGSLSPSLSTSRVAAVTLPLESLVKLNVTAAVPDPLASLPLTGGTSLDGSSAAVNVTGDEAGDGDVRVSSPQPVVTLPTTSKAHR